VIELPSVQELHLAFVEPSYATALMRRLVFPNLQSLTLDFDPDDYTSLIWQLSGPAPNQRYSMCRNIVELKLSGMRCSHEAVGRLYFALHCVIELKLNCHHLDSAFFGCLFAMEISGNGPQAYCIPNLTFLTTSGISGDRMRQLLTLRPMIQHVQMDSKDEVEKEDEAWLRAHTTSFEFFDDSDDEDEDDGTLIVDLTDSGSEGDGVLEEWVDDSDDEDDDGDEDDLEE